MAARPAMGTQWAQFFGASESRETYAASDDRAGPQTLRCASLQWVIPAQRSDGAGGDLAHAGMHGRAQSGFNQRSCCQCRIQKRAKG
jgi:hypothetical protein